MNENFRHRNLNQYHHYLGFLLNRTHHWIQRFMALLSHMAAIILSFVVANLYLDRSGATL